MAGSVSIQCPKCKAKLKLKNRKVVGKKVQCPKCKQLFVVKRRRRKKRKRRNSSDVQTSPPTLSRLIGDTAAQAIQKADRVSLVGLIAANLLPIVGVLIFKWDARAIVMLYWWENIIIGFFAILRIVFAAARQPHPWSDQLNKLFLVPFFCVHFGFFCAIHGELLLSFFGDVDHDRVFSDGQWAGPLVVVQMLIGVATAVWERQQAGAGFALLGLFISHAISFVRHYLLRGEFAKTNCMVEMIRPYARIVLMHVTILFGAVLVLLFGSPLPLLILLIFLKTCIDVMMHCYSHRGVMVVE